jgi:hypothetical protein
VAEIVNDAVAKAGREERKINPLLKKTRCLWLSNPSSRAQSSRPRRAP